nr:MAG TPA: hypothetical protein [Caudoviricetes sp.]
MGGHRDEMVRFERRAEVSNSNNYMTIIEVF